MKFINKTLIGLLTTMLLLSTGCEKLLTEEPTSDLTNTTVLQDVTGLNLLLQGTYRMMRDGNNGSSDNPATSSPLGIKLLSTVSGLDMMVNQEQVGNNWYFYTYSNQRYDATSGVTSTMWTTKIGRASCRERV